MQLVPNPDAALRNPPLLSKPNIVLFPKIPTQNNLHLRAVNPAEKEAILKFPGNQLLLRHPS